MLNFVAAASPLLLLLASSCGLVLPPRLQRVHDAVPIGACIADIGCDHGQLAAALAASGRAAAVYACDQSKFALQKAEQAARDAGITADGRVNLRLGDGFDSLAPEDAVDTAILSGLGTRRIVSILFAGLRGQTKSVDTIRTLVLQPIEPRLSQMVLLRLVLRRLGFAVVLESFSTSKGANGVLRPYCTITAERGSSRRTRAVPRSATANLLGPTPPLDDASFCDFLLSQRSQLLSDLRGRRRAAQQRVGEARQCRRIEAYVRVLDDALDGTARHSSPHPRLRSREPLCCAESGAVTGAAAHKVTLYRERNGWCVYSAQLWLALELKGIEYSTVLLPGTEAPGVRLGDAGGPLLTNVRSVLRTLDANYPNAGPPLWSEEAAKMADGVEAALPAARASSRAAFLFCAEEGFLYDPLPQLTFERTLDSIEALLGRRTASASADGPVAGPFLCGEALSAADVLAAPILERYAAMLPCFYPSLTPRDGARWPKLARWYEAMDCVGAYACRVRGDAPSWRKVLSSAPWWPAGWPARGGPDERGDPRGGALAIGEREAVAAFGGAGESALPCSTADRQARRQHPQGGSI